MGQFDSALHPTRSEELKWPDTLHRLDMEVLTQNNKELLCNRRWKTIWWGGDVKQLKRHAPPFGYDAEFKDISQMRSRKTRDVASDCSEELMLVSLFVSLKWASHSDQRCSVQKVCRFPAIIRGKWQKCLHPMQHVRINENITYSFCCKLRDV